MSLGVFTEARFTQPHQLGEHWKVMAPKDAQVLPTPSMRGGKPQADQNLSGLIKTRLSLPPKTNLMEVCAFAGSVNTSRCIAALFETARDFQAAVFFLYPCHLWVKRVIFVYCAEGLVLFLLANIILLLES